MSFYIGNTSVFVDSVTGLVFGPLFTDEDEAEDFVKWLEACCEQGEGYRDDVARYLINSDPRSLDGHVDWSALKAAYDKAAEAGVTPMTESGERVITEDPYPGAIVRYATPEH